MMIDFTNWPLLFIFAVTLLAILAGGEFGHRLALRSKREISNSIWTLEASLLGLLALMIGFTFSLAQSRFEARRDAVLQEANAIGTTALRARMLPAPLKSDCLKLLREYVEVRLEITRRTVTPEELNAAISRSNAIQEALWRHAMTAAARDNAVVPTGLFIGSLNQMIDSQQVRLGALRNRVPNIVLLALYGNTIIAITFAGYAAGLEKRRWRPAVYTTGIFISAVILLIQDLERPGAGFITTSQQPMIDTAAGIASFPD
jgi:hypothetical protein